MYFADTCPWPICYNEYSALHTQHIRIMLTFDFKHNFDVLVGATVLRGNAVDTTNETARLKAKFSIEHFQCQAQLN